MIAPDNIIALKQRLKNLIPEGIGISLQEIKHILPTQNPKYNELLQLERRLKEANRRSRAGMISYEVLQREYANITDALISLIDSIDADDFEEKNDSKDKKKSKQGSILHRIPDQMELNKESRCIVRLAFMESLLLEGIELDEETHIEAIRIADVMGVELLDPNEEKAFSIRTFNQSEQFLDEDDYCEWIFYVKPLLEGTFPLLLKVSVLEEIRGKERVREIVLEEEIQILTEAPVQDTVFQTADYQFTRSQNTERNVIKPDLIKAVVPSTLPEPAPIAKKRRFNYTPILALLLVGSLGIYIVKTNFYTQQNIETNQDDFENVNPKDFEDERSEYENGKERAFTIEIPTSEFANGKVTLMDSIGNIIPVEVEKRSSKQLFIILQEKTSNYKRLKVETETGDICYGKIEDDTQESCKCE